MYEQQNKLVNDACYVRKRLKSDSKMVAFFMYPNVISIVMVFKTTQKCVSKTTCEFVSKLAACVCETS